MNTPTPATRHAVDTARAVLAHLGLTPHDLLELPSNAPTFACAVPKLRPTLTTRTLSTYNTHLRNLETLWAERPLDEPTTAELTQLAEHAQTHSRTQRGTRNGASAREHFVSAVRCLYRYAEHNKWIHPHNNPARTLTIPARTPSHRNTFNKSAKPPPPPETIPRSTPCCCACIPKPHAAVRAHCDCALTTSTPSTASCSSAKRATTDGSPSPPPS